MRSLEPAPLKHLHQQPSPDQQEGLPLSHSLAAALSLATLFVACSSKPLLRTNDGAIADTGTTNAATDGGTGVVADSAPAPCVDTPQAEPGARSIVTVAVDLTYAGQRLVYGDPFGLPNGGTLTITNFRFYVSDIRVLPGGNQPTPVDVVAADGKPVPYNVHLVNADNASETTFRITVPAGDYTGLSFLFGLNDACNLRDPGASKPPLTFQSQLTWPRPFGFLFLRYEGAVTGATGEDGPLSALAMSGLPGHIVAPRVNADGAFRVSGSPGDTIRLRVALDEIFKAARLPLDPNATTLPFLPPQDTVPGGPPGSSEIEAGEHLRHNATKVQIFSVTGGP